MKMTQKEAFRIKGALWNAEQNKTTNNNSWLEEKKKKYTEEKWAQLNSKENKTTTDKRLGRGNLKSKRKP